MSVLRILLDIENQNLFRREYMLYLNVPTLKNCPTQAQLQP